MNEIKFLNASELKGNKLIPYLKQVYSDIVQCSKEGKYIIPFIEAGNTVWSHCLTVCSPPHCTCVEKVNLMNYIRSEMIACTPEMYEYMIEMKLIDRCDIEMIKSFFMQINQHSRLPLIDKILSLCNKEDMKKLVEYRTEEHNISLLDTLMHDCLGFEEKWLIGVISKFTENGFDLNSKTFPWDDAKGGFNKTSFVGGQSIIQIAFINCYSETIRYLFANGGKLSDLYEEKNYILNSVHSLYVKRKANDEKNRISMMEENRQELAKYKKYMSAEGYEDLKTRKLKDEKENILRDIDHTLKAKEYLYIKIKTCVQLVILWICWIKRI